AEDEEVPSATALREAEEELGLRPSDVELAGSLPPVHTRVTGMLILPFVGFLCRDPRFTPNAAEISEVLEYPLGALLAAGAEREGESASYPFANYTYAMGSNVSLCNTARCLCTLNDVLAADPWP